MLTALTKHILEEGGKKLIDFTRLEHDILDTLSRYARVLKSVLKKVDGLGLTTSLSTNISLLALRQICKIESMYLGLLITTQVLDLAYHVYGQRKIQFII